MELTQLYEKDETAWLETMSDLVKERRFGEMDHKNLSEYLRDMARRDRREVRSRLVILLLHMLKWDYQSQKRTKSWLKSMFTQRFELEGMFDSQTLKSHASDILPAVYRSAVKRAAKETGLDESTFPHECPYTLDQVLSDA